MFYGNANFWLRTVDEELAAKIQSELELEKMKEYDDDMPHNLREFLDNSSFEVHLILAEPNASSKI